MTWDQIELFAEKASERDRSRQVQATNLHALAVGVGFSGDTKPLKALSERMSGRGKAPPAPAQPGGAQSELLRGMERLSQTGALRKQTHGAQRRRTVRKSEAGH